MRNAHYGFSLCVVCADACPSDAITIEDINVIDSFKCVECGVCIDECPTGAISSDPSAGLKRRRRSPS